MGVNRMCDRECKIKIVKEREGNLIESNSIIEINTKEN
jgi:hypothetical protein